MSHDRGCFQCHEDPSEYANCKRADCPKRERFAVEPGVLRAGPFLFVGDPEYRSGGDQSAKNHDAVMTARKGVVEVGGELREHDGRALGRKLPADAEITQTHTRAEIDAVIAAVRNNPVERVTRIITVTEPGYDIALFMNEDGGAEAVITRPGLAPTGINIAPPAPGRRIVIERTRDRFEVVYRDVSK